MTETALKFFTQAEWYAMIGGLLLGWGVTEFIKRLGRSLDKTVKEPAWLYPLVGVLATALATFSVYPMNGLFPHRIFAALVVGVLSPVIYGIAMLILRHYKFDALADFLTGQTKEGGIT